MKSKSIVLIFAIISLFFGIIGFVLSFLPLGLISILPAIIGLVFWFVAYLIMKKSGIKRKVVLVALIISLLAILISTFSEIFIKDKVADDLIFNEKIEQSETESLPDLEEALDDLEIDDAEETENN